jgi:putative protease
MRKNNQVDIELLSPAGGFESLMAAVQGGADSVYFGVGELNMRSTSSKNFRISELPEIRKISQDHGLKTYVTLNTVMYDEDLSKIPEILDAIKENSIDAVIASDFAVIQNAHQLGIPVHISTQSNISNIESVRFFSKFADVMVLARELSIEQVKKICRIVDDEPITGPSGRPVRIEAFAHGALCMAVSGKCYLSLHEKNKSANRGECMQLCRRAYTVTEKEDNYQLEIDNEYIMSPKDLSTITFIDQLLDAGIKLFKIEGRGRPPEYVKTTTKCYRAAIEAWKMGEFTKEKAVDWEKELKTVFNRGFWEGYYMGKKSGEWSSQYGSSATRRKIYLGKGMNYFSKIGVAEFLIETGELEKGEQILITGPTTGVVDLVVSEIRVDLRPVSVAVKGQRCSIPVPVQIRRSDKLYKVAERNLSESRIS